MAEAHTNHPAEKKLPSEQEDRAFWLEIRRVLLDLVEVVERRIEIRPTTSEMRKEYRNLKVG